MRFTRRHALSLLPGLALPVLLPPALRAQTAPAPAATPSGEGDLVFVLNSGEANILVLDAATREEKRRIPVLREVHHLALTPDGSTLMVGDSGANEMLFLNPLTGELIRREALSNPYHLGFSPDGRTLVITSLRRDQVDIYGWDGAALSLRKRHSMPDMPSHLAFRPDNKVVYVTLQGNGLLAAISLETLEPLWTMEIGPEPAGVIWHKDRLLVGIMGGDYVAVADPETQSIERRITIGRGAHALFMGPKNDIIYATSRVDSRISLIDANTLEVVRSLRVPGGPDDLSFDPQGRIWATLRWTGRVAVVEPESGKIEVIRTGRSPHGILYAAAAALRAPATN
ncbi:YncE family protein [Pseudoroseomonas cervicalis]|uniref:YncE family protein n=1 Tax=Teichococcus cervicalis TaxID=204525 RepID=UPI0027833B61|nr:YncE family protein [Pseudoroseomonas cervicalis]MDQ1078223.1 DNA-binding beta-propeller fold protein YncE [Pseudoroseomonas cervicalis]